jgi:asparagine N-glycosylation enzyme membrane subunit Stt3
MTIIPATILLLGLSCSQPNENSKRNRTNYTDTTIVTTNKNNMTNYFPFKISDDNGRYTIIVETESAELYPKYADFFEKYEYSGNGYCWEGHITEILEKLNPELLQHIDFDPEAGAFFAYADTKENQIKIVELLSPIFADFAKLEEYVKKANRSRIDD